ncbi:DHA2 family efflux MFS transporter permease subunit [Diaminobutyricibacter tongyongensis]|uniref:DHA2 family efflux MFS transporter permease subunit n=1 Tax=Leifsonia tongyongensis TaxID=1268043 RepID=A0A6L9XVU9_9MICO|nr:DHA2 family efflux MFS transporter permease subunit [Diaminobutyricibacter tongyongensis]NEN05164.1 DHA2 family efflux MFS transporter permease subunit [Diaminobutyricibacter tongyongensis]
MKGNPRTVLIVAILASFVAFLDGSIVNVALPAITRDLGGGIETQQWVVDAYLLTLGSLILVAGSISDTFGRVGVLRAGLVIFGAASIVCAIAPTALVLIIARAVQGAGAALLVPSSLAMITATYAGAARAKAIGSWTAWTGLAFILGPLLGGFFVDALSWRYVFAVNVLPIAVTLVLLTRIPSSGHAGTGTRIDVTGAVLASLGLAGPVFALIEQGRLGWGSPIVYLPLILGIACFATFLWWESRVDHPMMPLGLFRVRNFGFGNLATAAIYAGISLGQFIITIFLQEVAGFTAFQAGLATIPLAILSISLSTLFGSLAGKYGPRLFMTVGPLIIGAGFLLMLTTTSPVNFWVQLLPGILLFGLGLSITVAPLTAAILGSISPAQSGIGSAINNAVSRVAGLIAVACAGAIVGAMLDVDAFHRVVFVVALLFIAGGIVSFVGIRNQNVKTPVTTETTAQCQDRPVAGAPVRTARS